jgi:cytoskeletal protein RodZ
MGYGSNSSYQGYQGGGGTPNNPYRGLRKDFEEVRSGGSSEPRMQSMEVLSGREYGLEYERDGEGVIKHRWTLYGLVGFLLLVVLVAPHRENSSSNLQMDTDGKEKATKQPADTSTSISASTQSPPSSSATQASSDDEWVVTGAPAVNDFSETNPSAAFISDCHLPPTFRLGADNNIYLNVTNYCLAEVGQTMYQMSNQSCSISAYN